MDIKLYGSVFSRTYRCIWTLCELGLEFEHISINLKEGQNQDPDFLEISPLGKIPAMEVNGKYITDSAAICTFLCDYQPEAHLIPTPGTVERAEHDAWMYFVQTELDACQWTMAKHKFVLPEKLRTKEVFKACVWEFNRNCEVVAKQLSKTGGYITGDKFQLADLFIAQAFFWATKNDMLEIKAPIILEYIHKIKSRDKIPSVKNYL